MHNHVFDGYRSHREAITTTGSIMTISVLFGLANVLNWPDRLILWHMLLGLIWFIG